MNDLDRERASSAVAADANRRSEVATCTFRSLTAAFAAPSK